MQNGEPAFGTYVGRCAETDFSGRTLGLARLRNRFEDMRWQWFTAIDDRYALGGAIVDAGLFGTAFLWVFDRDAGRMVCDEDIILPGPVVYVTTEPTRETLARVGVPRYHFDMTREADTVTVTAAFGGVDLSIDLSVDDGSAITAICPVEGRSRGFNLTQKETHVEASGHLDVAGTSHTLADDATAFLDYSRGLTARETRWDWALASGTDESGTSLAFNLVDQFNDGLENVVWVDGAPEAVGKATLETDDEGQWSVSTDCGTVDATLEIAGRRQRDIEAGILQSSYNQPLGRWKGTVDGHDFEGVGVAEVHSTINRLGF